MTAPDPSASQPLSAEDDRRDGRVVGASAPVSLAPVGQAEPPIGHAWRGDQNSWRFELFLAVCSAWVAVQLWFWPDQFPLGNTPMALSAGLRAHAASWALVCALAALLKLTGLACRFWTSWTRFSAALMICGLFMSIIMWTIVGATWEFDFPHSLAPIILVGGALGAAWQLAQWRQPPGPSV